MRGNETMVDLELTEIATDLLRICIKASPSDHAKAGFRSMYSDMKFGRMSPVFIVEALASALYNGITYGNWPKP